jgi:DNA-binding GntR family transcriptional regulator
MVGDQLPTEDSPIVRFGVSRITVRRAIQNLVSRGLVEIRRGKGTFVAAHLCQFPSSMGEGSPLHQLWS